MAKIEFNFQFILASYSFNIVIVKSCRQGPKDLGRLPIHQRPSSRNIRQLVGLLFLNHLRVTKHFSDCRYYNNLEQGYFTLYKNKELPYEVTILNSKGLFFYELLTQHSAGSSDLPSVWTHDTRIL